MTESDLEKINIVKRIINVFHRKPSPQWENIIIVGCGMILTLAIAIFLGLTNYLDLIIIVTTIVEMFVVQKIPLKRMARFLLILSLSTGATFLTATLSVGNLAVAVFFFVIWFLIFVILQLSESPLAKIGLSNIFTFFFAATQIETMNLVAFPVMGFLIVIVASIPMFISEIGRKDPHKRRLLAQLFDENITFHEFLENREKILKSDDSARVKSLIAIAMSFFIAGNNIKSLSHFLNPESFERYKPFENEINRLLNKVKNAILGAYDYDFELNLGYITEFQKDLEFKLNSIDDLSPKLELFNLSIKKYKTMFEDLNLVLADKKIIEEIEIHPPYNFRLNLKNNLSFKNNKLRYSIRFAVASFLGFITDLLLHSQPLYPTTLFTGFTLSPNQINTKKLVYLKAVSTTIGAVLSIVIINILFNYKIEDLAFIIAAISFLLFFVFEEDKHIAMIFFMLGISLSMPLHLVPHTAIEHLVATLIGVIIVLVVNYFVFPNDNDNLCNLILKKIKITDDFINDTLVLKKDTYKSTKKIIINNSDISKIIDEINANYYNVDKDIVIFSELNDTLGEIRDVVIGIDTYLDKNSVNYDFSKINKLTKEFFMFMSYAISEEKYILNEDYNFKELESEINKIGNEISVLKPSFESILNSLQYINNLIIKGESKQLFDIYNQDLV